MPTNVETDFQEILAPVASRLGFEMMRREFGARCSELRLSDGVLELEIFHDVIDEATVRVRFVKKEDSRSRGYAEVLSELRGSDFGLVEYLGGWRTDGFLPPNMKKVFAVIADTLPSISRGLEKEKEPNQTPEPTAPSGRGSS
jgi:hypothetical protein